jgi:hypothetical protein
MKLLKMSNLQKVGSVNQNRKIENQEFQECQEFLN